MHAIDKFIINKTSTGTPFRIKPAHHFRMIIHSLTVYIISSIWQNYSWPHILSTLHSLVWHIHFFTVQ